MSGCSSSQLVEQRSFQEVGTSAKLSPSQYLDGICEIRRPSQGAANLFLATFHDGREAGTPYFPFLPPKLHGAPWPAQDPVRCRAPEAESGRQRRNAARPPGLNARQLAFHYLRFFITGEVAEASAKFGGLEARAQQLGAYCGAWRRSKNGDSVPLRKGSLRYLVALVPGAWQRGHRLGRADQAQTGRVDPVCPRPAVRVLGLGPREIVKLATVELHALTALVPVGAQVRKARLEQP